MWTSSQSGALWHLDGLARPPVWTCAAGRHDYPRFFSAASVQGFTYCPNKAMTGLPVAEIHQWAAKMLSARPDSEKRARILNGDYVPHAANRSAMR
jgi:hypothetical protein